MLNIQIIPAPPELPPALIAVAQVVRLPAWSGQGTIEAFRLNLPRDLYPEAVDLLAGLPPEAQVQRTVRLVERGGGLTNTGYATIVAGLDGQPLPSRGGHAAMNTEHAVFFVPAALEVRYRHHRGQGSGTVSLVGVDPEAPQQVGVIVIPYWIFVDGDEAITVTVDGRRSGLTFPAAAVAAARAKARAYHCRSAYYTAAGGARGPSGALRGTGAAWGGLPSPFKGPGIGYEPSTAGLQETADRAVRPPKPVPPENELFKCNEVPKKRRWKEEKS